MQIYSKSVRNLLKAKNYIETERERKGGRDRVVLFYKKVEENKEIKTLQSLLCD